MKNFLLATIVAIVNAIETMFLKGVESSVVVFKSCDSDMRKGTKNARNPFLGRLFKRTVYGGVKLGTSYENSVNNTSIRNGGNGECEPKPNWHHKFDDWFQTNRDETKLYLKIQWSETQSAFHSCKTTYFLDGIEISKDSETFAEISKWFSAKSHTQSSTQTSVGLNASTEQNYQLIELCNVEQIKQGQKIWNAPKGVPSIVVVPQTTTSK